MENTYEEQLKIMRPIWEKIMLGVELTEEELEIAK